MSVEREGRGAMLPAPGEDVVVEEIVLEPPGPGEVQVRILATGVCHTELHFKNRNGRGLPFPILLGHEGAGLVEDVGEGVEGLGPGDPVVVAWTVPCGECPPCLRGEPRRCWTWRPSRARIRRKRDGATVTPVLAAGTFADRIVVPADAAVSVPAELPMAQACLIGCCVATGAGAVFNTTPVRPGSTVAVIGCGAVGLSAIQAARISGAGRIFAVDLHERKLDWAGELGATDLVDASRSDPVREIRRLTDRVGVDFAYEAVGLPATLDQAIRILSRTGTCTFIGVPEPDAEMAVNIGKFFFKRNTLTVCEGGDTSPAEDFPRYARMALEGELDLGRMVTRTVGLDDVEEAFRAMEAGEVIRSVILTGR